MKETKENSVREAWILCLILGLVMINFPFIHIFNTDQMILGIPVLILYFLIGWPASIAVIWLFVRNLEAGSADSPDEHMDNDSSR
ncbi:MAG: hypothetical protein OQK97_02475 [Deltaproteobacteria bacterium]|jgi:riboflavin transporter FmnP|nr:hypothetical protein [Deltaproteobacteria bacterium]